MRPVLAVVAAALTVGLTACEATYRAETYRERPTIPGVGAAKGYLALRDIYLGGPVTKGGSMPVYFSVANGGPDPDRFVRVSSPQASGSTGGGQTVDSQQVVRFYPDQTRAPRLTGVHGPNGGDVSVGQYLTVTFTFQNTGDITVQVPVEPDPAPSPSPSGSSSSSPSGSPSASAPSGSPSASSSASSASPTASSSTSATNGSPQPNP